MMKNTQILHKQRGRTDVLRDSLIALSIANLWFIDVWKLFIIRNPTHFHYHWKVNPAPFLLATMLDVLLLWAILCLAVTLARRSEKSSALRVLRSLFAVVFILLSTNVLLIILGTKPVRPFLYNLVHNPKLLWNWHAFTTIYYWLAALAAIISCLLISLMIHSFIFRRERLIKIVAGVVLIMSPFAGLTFIQATTQWLRYHSGYQFRESAAPKTLNGRTTDHRILWLVFDELDFRLSFIDRPATLDLPEFDRLRKESIFAGNAYPPSGDTVLSFPALINGRLVSHAQRIAPNELMLTFADNNETQAWSTVPSVFSKARAMGLNTGLAGWYHPYCRIIGSNLNQCSWEDTSVLLLGTTEISELIPYSENASLLRRMVRMARSLFLPGILRILTPVDEPLLWRNYFISEFSSIHRQSLAMATDPHLNLVFVHYSIPHPLGIYDRSEHKFAFDASSGYLDNLALADRVLAQLRQSMVAAGVWENTTVLVSSDHSLRADRVWRNHSFWTAEFSKEDPAVLNKQRDERIPFILKLAGEGEGLTYEASFNTVLSHDLVLAVLSGELSKKEDVVKWLDQHRSIAESPYVQFDK